MNTIQNFLDELVNTENPLLKQYGLFEALDKLEEIVKNEKDEYNNTDNSNNEIWNRDLHAKIKLALSLIKMATFLGIEKQIKKEHVDNGDNEEIENKINNTEQKLDTYFQNIYNTKYRECV